MLHDQQRLQQTGEASCKIQTTKLSSSTFLQTICEVSTSNPIIVTKGDDAISSQGDSAEGLAPYTHEVVDTLIFVHVRHAAMNRSKSVIVKANIINAVVIAVSNFTHIAELRVDKMWIAFGQAVHTHMIPIHEIISVIEPEKPVDYHSVRDLLGAMLCLPSKARRRSQPGRHGLCAMRYLQHSPDSASAPPQMKKTSRCWKDLCDR